MNILLSSYSVNPYHGSEDGTGWNWTLQLASEFSAPEDTIYLVTKKVNQADTQRGIEELGLKNVRLVIVDTPYWLNWYREHNSAFHHIYYILWQYTAYRWAKRSGIKFDIIHHATMGDFRIPGFMYRFKDAYTIFGPVGGGQSTPKALKCYERSKLTERIRELINITRPLSPSFKKAIKSFDRVCAVNGETAELLEKAGCKEVVRVFDISLAEEFSGLFAKKESGAKPHILYVGRLIHKKGILLMLDILDRLSEDYCLDIYGDGPLRPTVEEYINKKGMQEKIKLHGSVPFGEITKAYREGDIFLLPSLRETGGNVLVEAMAHGLPVVALDMSLCRELNKKGCGIFIDTQQTRSEIVNSFASALSTLINDTEKRAKLGQNGYRFVNTELGWDKKFSEVYAKFFQEK